MKIVIGIILSVLLFAPGAALAQRTPVTANFSVYVAPPSSCTGGYWPDNSAAVTTCGNDSTGNGTQGAPWATLQKAILYLYANYDFQGLYAPTIVLAVANSPNHFYYPGIWLAGRLLGQPGSIAPLAGGILPGVSFDGYNPFVIEGDPNNQLGAIIAPGEGDFPCTTALSLTDGAAVKVTGITLATLCPANVVLVFGGGSLLDISDVTFGNAGTPGSDGGLDQVGAAFGGFVYVTGHLTVSGSASSFMETGIGGGIQFNTNGAVPIKITLAEQPQYLNGMFSATYGRIEMSGVQFEQTSGTGILGTAAVAKYGGVINTSTGTGSGGNTCNPNYFPTNMGTGAQVSVQDNAVCR